MLVDADPLTYTLDPAALEAAITSRTRAIVPVHLYGHPVDLDAMWPWRSGTTSSSSRTPRRLMAPVFSAGESAVSGTRRPSVSIPPRTWARCGDGGMVTRRQSIAREKIRLLRNYGQREKYRHAVMGTNSRLDALQASILAVKLPHLDRWNDARRHHAARYSALLREHRADACRRRKCRSRLSSLRRGDRPARRSAEAARRRGVSTSIHYPIPVHLQEACATLGYRAGEFPVTEAAATRILSLPMYPELTDAQTAYVADAVCARG